MLLSDRDILAAQSAGHISLGSVDPRSGAARFHRRDWIGTSVCSITTPTPMSIRRKTKARSPNSSRWPRRTVDFAPRRVRTGFHVEYVKLDPSIAARLEGKSSLGRLGILTHSTAGFIDPGFEGHITLELSNVSTLPVKLWPGMKIGQMCFFQLSSPAEHPYGSKGTGSHYQGQRGPTPSRSTRISTARTSTTERCDVPFGRRMPAICLIPRRCHDQQ